VYLAFLGLQWSVSVGSTGHHDRDRAPTTGTGPPPEKPLTPDRLRPKSPRGPVCTQTPQRRYVGTAHRGRGSGRTTGPRPEHPWKAKPRPGSTVTSRTRSSLRPRPGVRAFGRTERFVGTRPSRGVHRRCGAALRSLALPLRSDRRIGETCVRPGDTEEGTGRSPCRRADRSERAGPAIRRNAIRRVGRGADGPAEATMRRGARHAGSSAADQNTPWKAKPRPGSAVTPCTRLSLRPRPDDPTIRRADRAVRRYAAFQGVASLRWCCTSTSRAPTC